MRRESGEQGACGIGAPAPGEHRCRQRRQEPVPREMHGMGRYVGDRAHDVGEQGVEAVSERGEDAAPRGSVHRTERGGGRVEGAQQDPGRSRVQGVRQIGLGPGPLQPVPLETQRTQERGGDSRGVHGAAVVVDQPGQRALTRTAASTRLVRSLQDGDARPTRRRPPSS
ncbi:hypothetical protein [Streptomyces sp. NPDC059909]|uniref:hypothetical protein n=1 Tax=Streptomyces sp. NPDC059909 TaxID=3346998 RepID=UPI003667E505